MKARVRWLDGVSFVAEADSGHAIVIDGPPDHGGRNLGLRPMELMLLGVGSCSAVDVILILKKARQQVVDCDCQLSAERADTVPAVFTSMHLHFVVSGHGLSATQVERAVKLSAEKYCSASRMLQASVNITHSCEIIDLDADQAGAVN